MANGRIFGRHDEAPILILARGDRIRHVTLRPWMTLAGAGVLALLSVTSLMATGWISKDPQASISHDYEIRIAALRDQLDRATARQFLDGQRIDSQIEKLLEQQAALSARYDRLGQVGRSRSVRSPTTLDRVKASLETMEQDQLDHIQTLAGNAALRLAGLQGVFNETGLDMETEAIGGPFVEPQTNDPFDASLTRLDGALARLDELSDLASKMPFANPVPDRPISSGFGNRVDPFFKRLALHAGIDFKTPVGAPVRSTGQGIVSQAGYAGGYGNRVEIDHGGGIFSRYGHLSSLLVNMGDTVDVGTIIGLSGSTGRSTGPHLHYELRRDGIAIDPMDFLNAGVKLAKYRD